MALDGSTGSWKLIHPGVCLHTVVMGRTFEQEVVISKHRSIMMQKCVMKLIEPG